MKIFIFVFIGVMVIALILNWCSKRDDKLVAWAAAYEKCVKVEYNMTPTDYYIENGSYPECEVEK